MSTAQKQSSTPSTSTTYQPPLQLRLQQQQPLRPQRPPRLRLQRQLQQDCSG